MAIGLWCQGKGVSGKGIASAKAMRWGKSLVWFHCGGVELMTGEDRCMGSWLALGPSVLQPDLSYRLLSV